MNGSVTLVAGGAISPPYPPVEMAMKSPGLSGRTTTSIDPVTGDAIRTETVAGRPVIHDTTTLREGGPAPAGALTAKELQRETQEAYERGRRDQRKAQKSSPLLTLLVVLLAVLGVAVGVLALRTGSFSGAGEVLDRGAATAADEAREASVQARDASGEAIQDAGAAVQGAGAEVEADAEAAAAKR
jgi:hypothetical protein